MYCQGRSLVRVRNPKNQLPQINSLTTVGCSLEYPIVKSQILEHNGLETQYILRLRARHGHVMKFTRSRCIFYGNNTFWTNLLHVFSITEIQFAQLIFIEHIRRYGRIITTESRPRLVFTKPGKPPQKRLSRSESYASPTKTNRCTELKYISVHSLRCGETV